MTSSEDSPRGGATRPALKPMCCVKCGTTAWPLTFISHSAGFGGFVRYGDLWCDACRAPSPATVAAELLALAEKAEATTTKLLAVSMSDPHRPDAAFAYHEARKAYNDAVANAESIALVCKALLEGQRAVAMTNESTTDYLAHFNAILNRYGEVQRGDWAGTQGYADAARSVDVLAEEYVKAADLLDRVRGHCRGETERACLRGEDYRAVAERFAMIYPPIANDLRDFCEVLEVAYPAASTPEGTPDE
ncbi:MAG: hypothetical protein JWL61_4971 [Gemmatimonadetes bacterium]|nr:hypothetical protein [Gemmatimonadota bacterium]